MRKLIEAGLINQEDVWRRIRLVLETGNPNVAKVVATALPEPQRPAAALLDQASRDPARLLNGASLDMSRRGDREIALYALDQLAKRGSGDAEQALRKRLSQFSADESATAWARLATWAARRHEPVALAWFQQAGLVAVNDFQREWWTRAALRAGDWQAVQRVIGSMGNALQAQPEWRYWRARALQAGGQRVAANAIFLALSREHHYYGQLAQEELGPVAQAPAINVKMGGDDVAAISRDPGIARALALQELGLRSEATQEWNWSVRDFSDPQLLAAAELARRMEWYDRAINTAERTRELHDFELRFLAPYRELAQQAASDNQIDEAWVFGLMRQESRFVNVARSSVGASGLMQIMPATARWIARRLGIKRFKPKRDAGSGKKYPVRCVLPEACAVHPGRFAGTRHRRLQCRAGPCPALARHPADGSCDLHRIDSVCRNTRLRQESDEQRHVLRGAIRTAFGAAERPAGHDPPPQNAGRADVRTG